MQAYIDLIRAELRNIWRFRWTALLTALAVSLLGWTGLFFTPSTYQARARVYVDATSALKPLLQGIAVDPNVDSELNYVREKLLSRPALETVARETELDLKATTPKAQEALIDNLRKNIDVELAVSGDKRSSDKLFTITYLNPSRKMALAVVTKLLNTFVENSMGAGRDGDENAERFLREQIDVTARELSSEESRLAQFKQNHPGVIWEGNSDYFERLNAERDALQKAKSALAIAELKLKALKEQLRGQVPYVPASSGKDSSSKDTQFGGDIAARLQEAESALETLRLKYTDKYPGVIAMQNTIRQLKAQQQEELSAIKHGDAQAAASSGLASNPVYQQIELELDQQQVQVAGLKGEIANHELTIAQLSRIQHEAPEVEAEFTSLNRGYSVTHAEYDELVTRLNRARITEQATEAGTIKFAVIDPPIADLSPVKPNRSLLTIVILLAGLGAGAFLGWMRSQLRSVYESTKRLTLDTGLPVIGSVSAMGINPSGASGGRRRSLQFYLVASLLPVAFALAMYLAINGASYSSWMS